ncbi:MAG: methyltransferase domain-containing protein [Bryobacteraceae bacterium]
MPDSIPDQATLRRMQDEWNQRAREDAHYYVAFGRRQQTDDEFFETGNEMVVSLASELKRLPRGNPRARRALEIGCGPGRLMKPLSRYFGEIHGVDVSDEMVRRAHENLRDVRHAHAHHTPDSTLAAFADESFDFVYSYAVFQHIPSRDVVLGYLREARRVLKHGGILRCQINGLPDTARRYDTWSGVRIPAAEISAFARENGLQLLAREGTETQYMWITCRKRDMGWQPAGAVAPAYIRRVTNSNSSEPAAPPTGRFAAISIQVENLPEDAGLNDLGVTVAGRDAVPTYIGPREFDGMRQVNALLPPGVATGLQSVRLFWLGEPLGEAGRIRILPRPPAVPRVMSVTDGINLMSGLRLTTGSVKATLEEADAPELFRAKIGGLPAPIDEIFCCDPRVPRHEINFHVPAGLAAGPHLLEMSLGGSKFPPVEVEVVG